MNEELPELTAGQTLGNYRPVFIVSEYVPPKSDSDSYARSRNLVYRRKIMRQKKAKNG